jgi:hypothetical protein
MSDSPGGAARGVGERAQQTVSDTIDDTKTAAASVYNQVAQLAVLSGEASPTKACYVVAANRHPASDSI